jgi:AraC family transcriptional regulator, transcriptional activator of the genes for pyochelin and ferripyochelin receptors
MTINLSGLDFWDLLENYTYKKNPQLLKNENSEITMLYPPFLGDGYKENIWLNNGIKLTIHSYQLHQDLVIDNTLEGAECIEFAFKLASNCQINNHCFSFNKSSYCIGKHEEGAIVQYQANTLNKGVDLHLDINKFQDFLQNSYSQNFPSCLQSILFTEQKTFSLSYPLKFNSAIELVIKQIINCPYHGLIKNIYLEGKSLELIALYFDLLTKFDQPYFSQTSSFKKSDIEGIYQAKEILEKNFDNPPTLSELAKKVRLSNRKLEEGFRQIFNHSVFGYLRQHRLEKARQLLETKEINISTVSSLVGYASHSAFTHAFQKQFGVTPKIYQKGDEVRG